MKGLLRMSWWLWIAYGAISAGILLYPSRFNLLIAQQAKTRGRTAGFVSAFGASIGLGLCVTLVSAILYILLNYSRLLEAGGFSQFLGWLGVSWLILTAFWTIGTVPYRLALPDNDNHAGQGLLSAFAESLSTHLLSGRFFGFFLALIAQFSLAPNTLTLVDFIHLQLATMALALLCYSGIALNPDISITWLRNLARKIAQRQRPNRALITSKAVKARYRKIAA
jgi:threonine/homoserine/homoserine lactone efflux protein